MHTSGIRPVLIALLLAAGLAIVFSMAGCGGGGSPPSSQVSQPSGSGPAVDCPDGTVSSFVGTSCSLESVVVVHYSSYSCTSTPTSICDALGPNGSNIVLKRDRSSASAANTIQVGETTAWDVTAGQSVDVVIQGTVYGAQKNGNWPHFGDNGTVGQSGDGTEENITTVGCGPNCSDSNNGVSDVPCNSATILTTSNCVDVHSIDPFVRYFATFVPATSASPYPLTIEIKLNGGTNGTANLFSVGVHLTPPK